MAKARAQSHPISAPALPQDFTEDVLLCDATGRATARNAGKVHPARRVRAAAACQRLVSRASTSQRGCGLTSLIRGVVEVG